MPPDELPRSAVLALHALYVGTAFAVFDRDSESPVLAVCIGDDRWVKIDDADLAALHERALVAMTDDDPADGTPREIDVTLYGKDFLRRWRAINRNPDLLLTWRRRASQPEGVS